MKYKVIIRKTGEVVTSWVAPDGIFNTHWRALEDVRTRHKEYREEHGKGLNPNHYQIVKHAETEIEN